MYKEKHILNHHTAGHKLSRYLDVYELNTVNCSADKTTGYKGDTITITGTPAWNEKTSSYSVTGATLTGNQFDFSGSDVTAQANYETAKSITTQSCSANKVSGFSGDNVTVTSTPAWNQKFSGYGITGATLTGNKFKIANSNVTVQGKYEIAKNVTLQATDGGSIAANRVSGFIGDSVTLSNTPDSGYEFSAYTLTGANLTGSTFKLTGSDVTAKAWFYLPPVNAHITYSMGNKFARDYLSNYTAFNEPDDVMNGLIEFGASGSNFGTDRYFAVKYDTRVATQTTDSRIAILDTQITLNDGVYILLHDTVEAARLHLLNPCINYHLPYGSPYLSNTAQFYQQNWIRNGELSAAIQITGGQYEYGTTAIRADYNQNALWFDGTVQPPADEWTYGRYNNARWSARDLCTHKFVFDKQAKSYSAFINSVARAKFTLDNPYMYSNITAIASIKLDNATNTDGAMFNLELASFSSLAEACRW